MSVFQSISVLQQSAPCGPFLLSAVIPVRGFERGSDRLVSNGQVARRFLLLLARQLVNEPTLPRLCLFAFLEGSREVPFRHGHATENLIKRQWHGRACVSAASPISDPLPHGRISRGWFHPSPRRRSESVCRATSSFSPTARPLPASQLFSAWSCSSQGQRKSPAPRSQTLSLPPNQPPLKPC